MGVLVSVTAIFIYHRYGFMRFRNSYLKRGNCAILFTKADRRFLSGIKQSAGTKEE